MPRGSGEGQTISLLVQPGAFSHQSGVATGNSCYMQPDPTIQRRPPKFTSSTKYDMIMGGVHIAGSNVIIGLIVYSVIPRLLMACPN